jgi:O-antigen ligase
MIKPLSNSVSAAGSSAEAASPAAPGSVAFVQNWLALPGNRAWLKEIKEPKSDVLRRRLLLLLGVVWGTVTGFSMASEEWAAKAQGAGLALALLIGMITLGPPILFPWFRLLPGALLTVHALIACSSGFHAGSEMANIVRYFALVPSFSIILATVYLGEEETRHLRLGLTLAGIVLVIFHLLNLEVREIADPSYRLTVFLNPNSTGFIAAITGVSAFDFALNESRRKGLRALWLLTFAACALLWLSTKSRTALLTLLAGVLTLVAWRCRGRKARFTVVVCSAVCLLALVHFRGFFIETLMLDDQYRSVATATGRFDIWHYILTEVFPEAPWLGVGPGNHNELIATATGSSGAHNGLLMALAETGLLGTVPLVMLLTLSFIGLGRHRHDPQIAWAAALFIAGVTESLGEMLLFSIGNPASLLFLMTVAALALRAFAKK